jgi:hypothetical protein
VTLTGDGLAYRLLDGRQAAAHPEDFHGLHAEVYADPPYRQASDDDYPRRFAVQRRQPGFVLAEARNGGYLVGYAAGMPLRPSTSWWRELTTSLPDEVTAEHPGRTVRARRPAGARVLAAAGHRTGPARPHPGRAAEERATLTVRPAATAAQHAFRAWGWRKVARAQAGPDAPVTDVLVIPLG